MKLEKLDLLEDVGTTYDQTRTTIQGRISQKTVGGVEVLGPQFNKFIDVFSDSGGTTPGLLYLSDSGRLFVAANAPTNSSIFGGAYDTLPVFLYDLDLDNGNHVYIGRIDILLPNLAATSHTLRSLKVYNDSTNSGWRIVVVTTASIAINGGVFVANNINKSDFAPIGFATIPMATENNQKAVYFLQDPNNIGAAQLNIASVGAILNRSNGMLYVHNGVSATHQYYLHDVSTSNLLMDLRNVSVSVGSPGVVTDTGHTFNNNDPVIFTQGTLPTGLTVGTVYFVRNPVAGVSYNLSTISGGANINTTGSPSAGAVITRAFGTTGSGWVHKTGNLPALTGTLLANDSEDFATPEHTTNSGFDCAFLATQSSLYLGRLSELTAGTTVWPSLILANQLGGPSEIINIGASVAAWSNSLDRAVFTLGQSRFIIKRLVSNEIDDRFGTTNLSILEGLTSPIDLDFGCNSITNMDFESGWLAINSIATGQRGIFLKDIRADVRWDQSYIVSKVLNVFGKQIRGAFLLKELSGATVGLRLFYRNSNFSSITGSWTEITFDKDISLPLSDQIQFKIAFRVNGRRSTVPPQVNELLIKLNDLNEISSNWEYSHDDSNPATNTVAYRLKKAYISSVPNLRHTVRDLSNTLLANHTTAANSSFFQYSIDGGVNWSNLGVIPNVVGTLVRYINTSLPNQELRPALIEA
jgi:hypothetical protein